MANSKTKVMPHSVEAEEAILGCIIRDSEKAFELIPELTEEDFYSETCKIVFNAVSKIYYDNKTVDLVTAAEKLESEGNMEKIGGIDYLTKLTTFIISTANAGHYLEIVKTNSLRRKLIKSSQNIMDKAFSDDEEVLDYAEKQIYDIGEIKRRTMPTEIGESFNEVVKRFKDVAQDRNAFRGITTGFRSLDLNLNGLQKSDLILVAARPGEGKTSLAMNIVENAAILAKATCLVFSLEMSKSQLAQRMLCSHARVSMQKAVQGRLEMKDWEKIWAAKEELGNTRILIDDTASITPADMLSKARRIKNKYGSLDLIMIDYIQLMTLGDKNNKDNKQAEVAEISRRLKLMAKEMDVPVIALSQMSRLIENRKPPIPQLSDLRDSGAIEQDADIVMFIYNPAAANAATNGQQNFNGTGNSGLKELIIAKHRNGPVGSIKVRWVGEYVRYEDASDAPDNLDVPEAPLEEIQEGIPYSNDEEGSFQISDDIFDEISKGE